MNTSRRLLRISVALCCIGFEITWLRADDFSMGEFEPTREDIAGFNSVHGIAMPLDMQVTFARKREQTAKLAREAKDVERQRRIEAYWKNRENKTVVRWCSAAYSSAAGLTASDEIWKWVRGEDKNEFHLFTIAVLFGCKVNERSPTSEEVRRLKALLKNRCENVRMSSLWTLLRLGVRLDDQEVAEIYERDDPGLPKDFVLEFLKGPFKHQDLSLLVKTALVAQDDRTGRWAIMYVQDWGGSEMLRVVRDLRSRAERGELAFGKARVRLLTDCVDLFSRDAARRTSK